LESVGLHQQDENGRCWLDRCARITIDVSNCLLNSAPGLVCLEVELIAGPDEFYQRFPFNVEIGLDGRVVKVLEFERGNAAKTVKLPVSDDGRVNFSVVSELACVPAQQGLGADQREHALLAGFRMVLDVADTDRHPHAAAVRPFVPTVMSPVEPALRPIFVVGMYRSGTSILTWALGQHPNIWALEETGWLLPLGNALLAAWERARGAPGQRSFSSVYELYPEQFLGHFAGAIDSLMKYVSTEHALRVLLGRAAAAAPSATPEIQVLRALGSSKRRWVDGTPENIMCAGQLRAVFPLAKFIHIVRHPLDVVTSMVHFNRAGGAPMTAPQALAMWRERVAMGYLAERAYGSETVIRLDYHDLIARPDERMRELFRFLGEPDFDAAAQAFTVRINSSLVQPEEIEAARQSLPPDDLDEAVELYAEAGMPLDAPLRPEPAARAEIDRLIGQATRHLLGEG
jgi:hypothetical protein